MTATAIVPGVLPDVFSLGQISTNTPLDHIFAQYRRERAGIDTLAQMIELHGGALRYFLDAFEKNDRSSFSFSFSFPSLSDPRPAINCLNAEFWQKVMLMSGVLDYMPAAMRNDWHEQIRKNTTPEFEEGSVRETIATLMAKRSSFLSERVDGLFRALSGNHVTNTPEGFGKRMIIENVVDSFECLNCNKVAYIHDLRCVISRWMGRGDTPSGLTFDSLRSIVREAAYGEWHSFDGGAFKIRLYKKGTAHLEVHPDMAVRLNEVLAYLHPHAIPARFRTKKPSEGKSIARSHLLLPFDVIRDLSTARYRHDHQAVFLGRESTSDKTGTVLGYIGRVRHSNTGWRFEYDPTMVIAEIVRTGSIPEQKSHQFYATKESLARFVVELADIGDASSVLEPEAGMGGIAQLLPKGRTTCVEISKLHCSVLEAMGFASVICEDFLRWSPGARWDRICMNPPFSQMQALEHVRKAVTLLAGDGVLVAVLPDTYRGRDIIPGMTHEWHGPFEEQFDGTGVRVSVLKLKHN